MAIHWPTPGFTGRTFKKLCNHNRWYFNFCVRSSLLQGKNRKPATNRSEIIKFYPLEGSVLSCQPRLFPHKLSIRPPYGTRVYWLVECTMIQNTQEVKRTLLNWTKEDKTCKFSRKSSFLSYAQQKNKQLIQLVLCQLDVGGWRKEKGRDWLSISCPFPSASLPNRTDTR